VEPSGASESWTGGEVDRERDLTTVRSTLREISRSGARGETGKVFPRPEGRADRGFAPPVVAVPPWRRTGRTTRSYLRHY